MKPSLAPSASHAYLPAQILGGASPEFKQFFNKSSFQFSHQLATHPLFELDRLVELADFLISKGVQPGVNANTASVGSSWSGFSPKSISTVLDSIKSVDQSGSWVLLYSVQNDPEYADLLQHIISELEEVVDQPLHRQTTWLDAYIFIASPHSITSYHIDYETTFLFQIQGVRQVNIFNGFEPFILTDEKIEKYYIGYMESAEHSGEKQNQATVYDLTRGTGVHHPPHAPHWHQNGDEYSIALGVHFCSKEFDQQAEIYQVNHYLREFNLKPNSPGESAWRDRLKIGLIDLLAERHPPSKYPLLRSCVHKLDKIMLLVRPRKFLKCIQKNSKG